MGDVSSTDDPQLVVAEQLAALAAADSPATVVVARVHDVGSLDDSASGPEAVLSSVRARLQQLVRSSDVLVEFDPGEFVMVAASASSEAGAALVDRARGVAALPIEVDGAALSLRVDVGVAVFDGALDDADVVVDAARADARGGG
jgi:GGDEF domain-containing protein